jgi:hypothetical protein
VGAGADSPNRTSGHLAINNYLPLPLIFYDNSPDPKTRWVRFITMSDPDGTNCFYLDIDERAARLLQEVKADNVMDSPQ